VLVTFSSDDYEAGNGFRLGFELIETKMTKADADNDNPVVSYYLVHLNHPVHNHFSKFNQIKSALWH